jgi:2,3-bisphosphoglycerate-independent phosphoglycerate mutase
MKRSEAILEDHPVNIARRARGDAPANMLWLFWGSPKEPEMPPFSHVYGLDTVVTSAVDVINGLAKILGMEILEVAGVTDGMDNDFAGQADAALAALDRYDMAVIHVEAPDEAGHGGDIDEKIEAIEIIDREVISRLRAYENKDFRVLIMPDHPTPIEIRTHSPEPVPFLLWGSGITSNKAGRYTEAQAGATGLFIDPGYTIMNRLVKE